MVTAPKHVGNRRFLASLDMDISLLRWPEETGRRARLTELGQPRLLLVEADVPPPICPAPDEDWVRLPCPEIDIQARLAALRLRCGSNAEHGRLIDDTLHTPAVLEVDDDGVLRNGGRWVALPPIDARLTRALLVSPGSVVSRADLQDAGWPDSDPNQNTLDVHIARLRKRLNSVDVRLRTVRSRGYLLERSA